MDAVIRLACAGALGALLLAPALSGAARAEEGVAMRDLLGSMGLIEKPRPTITYRERPPLVIPPKNELRPPVDSRAAAASPEWPNDPDVAARRQRAAAERVPTTASEVRRMSDANPRLTNDELRAGTRAGAGIPDAPVVRHGDNSREGHWVHPDLLRAQSKVQEEATVLPSGEPERKRLDQPPTGYRRSANNDKVRGDYQPVIRQSDNEQSSPFAFINRNLFGKDDD